MPWVPEDLPPAALALRAAPLVGEPAVSQEVSVTAAGGARRNEKIAELTMSEQAAAYGPWRLPWWQGAPLALSGRCRVFQTPPNVGPQ